MNQHKHIGFEIKTLSNLIKRQFDQSSNKKEIDNLTGTNGWVIGYLANNQHRDVFQRDLELEFSIRRSTASKILQLMEKKGFIKREAVEYDARLKKLVLTEKALEVHAIAQQGINQLEEKISKGLTNEEIETFFKIAEKIKKNLE
ncbi:MAG: MarR family winged helix-turn-helix transcriptional regulator [Clostridium sp.]|nr:MarR family winged helix-turn-helix transcriptional regulator [Clostridium sp.]